MRSTSPLAAVGLAIALVACAGASAPAPTPSADGTSSPATARPRPPTRTRPSVSKAVTATPTADATLGADLAISDELLFAWPAGTDGVGFQVVIELWNEGPGWAEVYSSLSSYQILDDAGTVVDTGVFAEAYPKYIAPESVGYVIDDIVRPGRDVADYVSVTTDVDYVDVPPSRTTFDFTGVTWLTRGASGGLVASGEVTANRDIVDAGTLVLCMGNGFEILGATTSDDVHDLEGGVPTAFTTLTPTPPRQPEDCIVELGYGRDNSF